MKISQHKLSLLSIHWPFISFIFSLHFYRPARPSGDLNPLVVDHMFGVRIDDLLHGLEETHRTPRPWKIRERRGKYVAVPSERVGKTHTDDTFLAFLRSLGKQVVGSKYVRTNALTALNTTNKH